MTAQHRLRRLVWVGKPLTFLCCSTSAERPIKRGAAGLAAPPTGVAVEVRSAAAPGARPPLAVHPGGSLSAGGWVSDRGARLPLWGRGERTGHELEQPCRPGCVLGGRAASRLACSHSRAPRYRAGSERSERGLDDLLSRSTCTCGGCHYWCGPRCCLRNRCGRRRSNYRCRSRRWICRGLYRPTRADRRGGPDWRRRLDGRRTAVHHIVRVPISIRSMRDHRSLSWTRVVVVENGSCSRTRPRVHGRSGRGSIQQWVTHAAKPSALGLLPLRGPRYACWSSPYGGPGLSTRTRGVGLSSGQATDSDFRKSSCSTAINLDKTTIAKHGHSFGADSHLNPPVAGARVQGRMPPGAVTRCGCQAGGRSCSRHWSCCGADARDPQGLCVNRRLDQRVFSRIYGSEPGFGVSGDGRRCNSSIFVSRVTVWPMGSLTASDPGGSRDLFPNQGSHSPRRSA
jgi:hypothetical protein